MKTINALEYRIYGKAEGNEDRPLIGQAFLEAAHVGGADTIYAGAFLLTLVPDAEVITVELSDE